VPASDVVHVLAHPRGRWLVRVGDDTATMTEHPTVNLAERQALRRASALGIDVVLVHDRYERVHESRAPLGARSR
jgi:hypothetical protein